MSRSRIHVSVMALVVVAVTALPAFAASAAAPCKGDASTPFARADLWLSAVEQFRAAHPNLNAEQARFVDQAVTLSEDLATQPEDARAQIRFFRKARNVVERSHELFTRNQLGELYSAMGGP